MAVSFKRMLSADVIDDSTYIKNTGTKVFTGKTIENRQLIVYETKFDFHIKSRKPMALILPVPANNVDDISIVSIDETFFNKINSPEMSLDSMLLPEYNHSTKPVDYKESSNDVEKLDISICANVQELIELSKKFYVNDKILNEISKKYSSRKFAFIIAQILPSMKNKRGIFAYSHKILRHETLFIPGFIVNSKNASEMEIYDHIFFIHNAILNKVAQGHIDISIVGIIKNYSLTEYNIPDGYLSTI
jgi:hypothetical protein